MPLIIVDLGNTYSFDLLEDLDFLALRMAEEWFIDSFNPFDLA